MLKQILLCTGLITSVFSVPVSASGAQYGTPSDAKNMLSRAITEIKTDKPAAIAKFNHNDPRFRDRDLFVFCFNAQDGKFTAHEAMVGWDVRQLHDTTGRWYGEQMYLTEREDRVTEVAFISPVPGSTEYAARRAYLTRIGDQVCGVSAYLFSGPGEPTQ